MKTFTLHIDAINHILKVIGTYTLQYNSIENVSAAANLYSGLRTVADKYTPTDDQNVEITFSITEEEINALENLISLNILKNDKIFQNLIEALKN
jgi:hypothetical protein